MEVGTNDTEKLKELIRELWIFNPQEGLPVTMHHSVVSISWFMCSVCPLVCG